MGGLFGGGGGSGGGVYQQPAPQSFQNFLPTGQPEAAGLFQGLENQLNNLGWSGLSSLPGGVTATTQLYPQVQGLSQNIAGQDPGVPYSYGSYGNVGLQGALTAAQQGLDPSGLLALLYGQAGGLAGQVSAAGGNIFSNAFNPQFAQALSAITNNPYLGQAQTGAQTGAGIGGQTAQDIASQIAAVLSGAQGLPGAGQQAAATTGAATPTLQSLLSGQAGLASSLSGQALGFNPQLAALYGQTVPQIQGLESQLVPGIQGYAGQIGQGANYLQNLAQSITGQGQLTGAAQNILNTGFDPQRALYNQTAQQTLDQANAAAALSGVAGTPYGAGVAANAAQNFNINWQNQQLARQQAALGAAGGAYGQAAGLTADQGALAAQAAGLQGQAAGVLGQAGQLGGNLLGQAGALGGNLTAAQLQNVLGAGNIYNQAAQGAGNLAGTIGQLGTAGLGQQVTGQQAFLNQILGGLGLGQGAAGLATSAAAAPYALQQQQQQNILQALLQQNQAGAQGAGGLAALTGALGQAGQVGATGLQNYAALQGLPYNTALTQQQNALAGLTGQANFGNQLLNLPQQSLQNLESYLGLGQSASALGGQLQALESQLNQPNYSSIGSLLNTGLGGGTLGNLIYGSGGLSGALNLGSGGLLGSLPQTIAAGTGFQGGLGGLGLGIPGIDIAGTTGGSGLLGFLGNLFGSGGTAATALA